MRCKHENADHLRAGEGWALMDGTAMPDALCEQFRCLDCGAWLSMGPSDDEPEAVKVEIVLADRLADLHMLWEPGKAFNAEVSYFVDKADDVLLARCIATHEEG